MNLNSIVRILDAESHMAGMGFAISNRHIATCTYIVEKALKEGKGHPETTSPKGESINLDLASSSSKVQLPSTVVGWSLLPNQDRGLSILEVKEGFDDILEPAPLIVARDYNLYSDRNVRVLVYSNSLKHEYYNNGILQGSLANGLVQVNFNFSLDGKAFGAPVWDIEASAVVGIVFSARSNGRVAFMVPVSALSEAWPGLDYLKYFPEASDKKAALSKPKIFICHAHEDAKVALSLYDRLRQAGYEPWIDKQNLLPGQKWDDEIRKAVKHSEFFMMLLSEIAVKKQGYIQKEFKLAMDVLEEMPEGKIYLLPVKLDDCLVPTRFSAYQWVSHYDGPEGFEKVIKAIEFQRQVG
jgi:hypothetical protein